MQFFRNIFKSRFGVAFTLVFLALIAFAFASSDVANTSMFGGVAGGNRVAVVGDKRISTADLTMSVNNRMQGLRQENPQLSMEAFVSQGGIEQVLEQMLSRAALAEFGRELGLRASDRLIDSEIVSNPAFRGLDGNFNAEAFRAALAQQGVSESAVRDDLAMGLYARQMLVPVIYGAQIPESFARRYAVLLNETRIGRAARLDAAAFAPQGNPTAEQLQEFYDSNRSAYVRPERRVIRYASFTDDVLDLAAPTEQQIAERYRANSAAYAASEQRSFTQLVLPTQAAAQAVVDEVEGGTSLEASAQAKGLATTANAAEQRAQLASNTSPAVASAVFSASQGAIAGPARGSLGWYVVRVDEVEEIAGRSLAQVRGEIAQELQAEQRRAALSTLTERIEDEFADGRSLSEVAQSLGLEVQTTAPLTADGQIYRSGQMAPEELAPVLPLAFEMDEGDPTLAELAQGTDYLVFDVADVTESATAPLPEIRPQVVAQWRRAQGMEAAAAAAKRVLDRVRAGATLAAALEAEQVDLAAPETLRINRRELAEQGQLSRLELLLFSMAEGTTKQLEMNERGAWYVVQLDEIETAELAQDDPVVASVQQQLASNLVNEYGEQFIRAAQQALEIERNEDAIDAVRAQLTGQVQ